MPVQHTLQGRHVALDDVLHLQGAHSAISGGAGALSLIPNLGPSISEAGHLLAASWALGMYALIKAHRGDGEQHQQLGA